MAILQPYKKYNPIAYEYATQLPDGWKLLPNIAIFQERIERGHISEELLSVTIGKGVIRQTDVDIKKDSSNEDKSKYKLIKVGDIAYNKMRMWQGALGYSNYQGISSPAYVILRPKMKINPRYFHYMFRTSFYTNYSKRFSYGIVDDQLSLRYTDFKRMYSIVPPIEVQNSIVAYLDNKNYKIDKFIRNKERLIELLEEEKKTTLYNAVTKGLGQNDFFKSSNINWLPVIPNNWIIKRLKQTVSKISGGITPSMDNQSFWDGDIFWVTSKDMKTDFISESEMKITQKALQQTSVKLIPTNSILLVVRSGILQHTLPVCMNSIPITINQDLKAITVNLKIFVPEYFRLLLKGIEANILHECRKAVATVESIEMNDFKNFSLPTPPIQEQQEIVRYINQAFGRIDLAITKAQKEISSIKEYREVLVTDLVTGKRSVPQLQMN
jgi:type I restriction enzyme, S subunit